MQKPFANVTKVTNQTDLWHAEHLRYFLIATNSKALSMTSESTISSLPDLA